MPKLQTNYVINSVTGQKYDGLGIIPRLATISLYDETTT